MRNKYLIIIIATLLFSCGAHEKKKSSSNLLGKAVHLSDNEAIELKNKPNARIREAFNELYQIDSITIAFSEIFNEVLDPNVLVIQKAAFYNLANDISYKPNSIENYSSTIENISNNHILIQKIYFIDDNNVYDFVIVNSDFTKRKLGIIQFHKKDEKQATTILNGILKDFKF